MKEKVVRFGVSMMPELLNKFDTLFKERGYSSRSEAIRSVLKKELVEEEWEKENEETIGILTVVYDHHHSDLVDELLDRQHHFYSLIVSTLHIHLDENNCTEVIAIRGKVKEIREVGKSIISIKGIKYSNLALATTGKEIP